MNFILEISKQIVTLVDIERNKVLAIVENDARTSIIFIKNNKGIYIYTK